MAKVQKPSVSPDLIGLRPKKKSPVEDFAGTLAVQAGKTLGSNQPARTAFAEGQNQKAAIVGAAHGLGRHSATGTSSSKLEGPSQAKPAEVLAVRSAKGNPPAGGLPESSTKNPLDKVSGDTTPALPASRPIPSFGKPALAGEPPLGAKEHNRPDPRSERRPSAGEMPAARLDAPVSVAAAPRPAFGLSSAHQLSGATPLTPLHQVASLIISRAPESSGQVKAEITLFPESLGTVQVHLTVDPSGMLSAAISASPEAVVALAPSLSDLRSALQDSGLQLSDLDLQSDTSKGGPGQHGSSAGSRSVVTLAGPEAAAASTAALIDGGQIMDVSL